MPNTNPETGIRYGVASLHSLQDWVFDEFFTHGTNDTADAALAEFKAENPDADDAAEQEFWDSYEAEEECYSLETDDGLKLGLSYLGGAALVWVFESPVRCTTGACSPCVPGAGDLNHSSLTYAPTGDVYALPLEWSAANEG